MDNISLPLYLVHSFQSACLRIVFTSHTFLMVFPLIFCRCATAYILLAEEEATTIVEAEKLFKQALKAGEGCYRRSQQLQHHGAQYEAQHSKFLGGRELPKSSLDLGFGVFCFPLRTMQSVFDIGWNVVLEPDYSVLVVLLDSVAEMSMLRLQAYLYFVMAENAYTCT